MKSTEIRDEGLNGLLKYPLDSLNDVRTNIVTTSEAHSQNYKASYHLKAIRNKYQPSGY